MSDNGSQSEGLVLLWENDTRGPVEDGKYVFRRRRFSPNSVEILTPRAGPDRTSIRRECLGHLADRVSFRGPIERVTR